MAEEANLESRCMREATRQGALLLKWQSQAQRGIPDRILILNGQMVPIEFKSKRGKMTKLQEQVCAKIEKRGVRCHVVNSFEQFTKILETVKSIRLVPVR